MEMWRWSDAVMLHRLQWIQLHLLAEFPAIGFKASIESNQSSVQSDQLPIKRMQSTVMNGSGGNWLRMDQPAVET